MATPGRKRHRPAAGGQRSRRRAAPLCLARLCLAVLAAGLALAGGRAAAAEIRAWDFDTFGRVIVDFGETTGYSVEVASNAVAITFDQPFPEDGVAGLEAASVRLGRFVSGASFSPDRTVLILSTTGPMRVNDFAMGDGIAIDLWRLSRDTPAAAQPAEAAEPEVAEAPEAEQPAAPGDAAGEALAPAATEDAVAEAEPPRDAAGAVALAEAEAPVAVDAPVADTPVVADAPVAEPVLEAPAPEIATAEDPTEDAAAEEPVADGVPAPAPGQIAAPAGTSPVAAPRVAEDAAPPAAVPQPVAAEVMETAETVEPAPAGGIAAAEPEDRTQLAAAEDEAEGETEDGTPLPYIPVRIGQHPGFSRIVFDMPERVPFRVVRVDDTVIAELAIPARADLTATWAQTLSEVSAIRQISDGGDLEVGFAVSPDTQVRYFGTETQVIIDVIEAGSRVVPIPGSLTANVTTDRPAPDLPIGPIRPPLPSHRPAPEAPTLAAAPDEAAPEEAAPEETVVAASEPVAEEPSEQPVAEADAPGVAEVPSATAAEDIEAPGLPEIEPEYIDAAPPEVAEPIAPPVEVAAAAPAPVPTVDAAAEPVVEAGPEPASPAGEPAIAETAPPPAAEPVDVAEPQAVVEVAAVVEETPQATEIAAAPVASEDAPPAAEDPARPPTEAATVAETVAETVVETAAAEPPVEAPVEAPAEVSAEVPAETVADVPTEQPVEAPAAVAAEVPTEHPAEAPAVAGPPAGEPAAPEVQLAEAQPNHAAAPVALPVPQPRGDELRAVASGGAAPPTLATADRATLPDLPGLPHLAQAAPGELAAEPLDALPATPVEEVALEHAGDGLDIPPAVPPQALVEPPAPPERPMPDRAVTFAFAHPVRAAVFQRGDGLWLVFQSDTPGLLDPAALMAQATDGLGEALTAAAEGGVAVRVSIAHGEQGQARLDGSQWTIGVAAAPQPPAHPIAVDADAGSASGGRVLIAVPGAPSPVRFIDPVIGDRLIVVTVDDAGAAVATERGFARFSLPTTAAGAVIVPRTEALGVVAVPEGVAISSRDGLELSRPEDALAGDTAGASGHDRLLDLAGWRGDPGEFLDNRGALQRRVAQTDGVEQDRTRLELARFLFANGQETEALGILGLVADSNAWLIDDDAANRAMRGAALALDGEGEAALVDLTAPDLDNSAEARLWQGVVAARHHDWEAAAPAFANAEEILDGYPDWLLARLAPLGIEAFLETGDVSSANALLEALSARPVAHDLDPLGEYWAGRIAAARNDPITARSSWEAAAAGPDRLYRRRAEMALLDLAREGGEVTPDEEVERLEELRYAWRGDDLEFDVLDQLGDAYWRAGRLRDAITVWQQAIDAFPELAETVQLGERVPERLNELFSPDRIETLPPFHILALYREYQDILADLPEWRDIRLRMADRLAAVDLLDEAAELLVGVMTELEPGAERARIGARSAALRLLDRDPQAALNTLDASLAGAQDDAALAYERRLLRARALSELDETDAALVLLEGDNRPLTLATRLDIARRARDWPLAAATLAQMADPPPEEGATLSSDQARLVLNRAVALALAGDRGGLDALAETYGPSLEGTPLESTFAMIVRPGGTPRMSDLDAIRSEVEEIDLFQNFLSTYREGNPGAAARSPTMN